MVTDTATKLLEVEFNLAQLPGASAEPPRAQEPKFKKRIIVCCDGTWQDGVMTKESWKQTNILKLSRAITQVDERSGIPIQQIVFYQKGIGSGHNIYSEYFEGATGASLIDKVEEAYAFISQNYNPGDEIFLFGFSRGAYTARMVAMFIGAIGVLDRTDMDQFPEIFLLYQKLGKATDSIRIEELNASLNKWTSPESHGKTRANSGGRPFSIKCVGVFDTVGSVGLPEELTHKLPSTKSVFGFPNNKLGEHIEHAFHALAMNETRLDFNCCKFEQTDDGRQKGQILKQCWFSGSHSDIGGGWPEHDLSDITLVWMIANIGDMLLIHDKHISLDPVAPWGEQPVHQSRTGIFVLSEKNVRQLPTAADNITYETFHPSVLRQKRQIQINPALVCKLLPLEERLQKNWPYIEGSHITNQSNVLTHVLSVSAHSSFHGLAGRVTSVETNIFEIHTSQAANSPTGLRRVGEMCKDLFLASG